MLIIDYLQLIDSEKSMSERERIAAAYPRLLDYCKKKQHRSCFDQLSISKMW